MFLVDKENRIRKKKQNPAQEEPRNPKTNMLVVICFSRKNVSPTKKRKGAQETETEKSGKIEINMEIFHVISHFHHSLLTKKEIK